MVKSPVSYQISKLVREYGVPHKQAIAIALNMNSKGRLGVKGGYIRSPRKSYISRSKYRSPKYKSPKRKSSPKRGSPKYKSPKRKSSPKRDSPKYKSPKRKSSPKRDSPKYKSPKRKSPKRDSTKLLKSPTRDQKVLRTRKSGAPRESATLYELGTILLGTDGNMYKIIKSGSSRRWSKMHPVLALSYS